jgi:hypothetical protein
MPSLLGPRYALTENAYLASSSTIKNRIENRPVIISLSVATGPSVPLTPSEVLSIEVLHALSHSGLEYRMWYLITNIFPLLIVQMFTNYEKKKDKFELDNNLFILDSSYQLRSLAFHLLLSFCTCFELRAWGKLPPPQLRLHELMSFFSLNTPFYIDGSFSYRGRDIIEHVVDFKQIMPGGSERLVERKKDSLKKKV